MREKRLRKQEMEEQASSTSQSKGSAEAEPRQKQAVGPALKRNTPVRASLTPADSSSPSSDSTSTQKPPARKPISLKPKATSPVHSTTAVTTTAAVTAVTPGSVTQSSPPRQAEADSLSQSPSSSRDSPAPSPVKQARAAPTQEPMQKKSPGQTTDTKGTGPSTTLFYSCTASAGASGPRCLNWGPCLLWKSWEIRKERRCLYMNSVLGRAFLRVLILREKVKFGQVCSRQGTSANKSLGGNLETGLFTGVQQC